MKSFEYTIKDAVGIHARPAGLLVKLAKELGGTVTIDKGGKCVDVTKLFALMGLGVSQGDTVTINVSGGNEDAAVAALKEFFEANL